MLKSSLDESVEPPAPAEPLGDAVEQLPVIYIELDDSGCMTRVNERACRLFGMEMEELLGRPVWEYMVGDEIERSRESYFSVMAAGVDPAPIRRSVYSKDGSCHTLDVFRTMVRGAGGRPAGMRHFAFEITEPQKAQTECESRRVWLESVLASMTGAVIVMDALGRISYMNPAAEELTGWRLAEAADKLIEEALPLIALCGSDPPEATFRTCLERRCSGFATVLDRKQYQIQLEFSSAPLIDLKSGCTTGVVSLMRAAAADRS